MKVTIREQSETDRATLDEFYADEEVPRQDTWIPEFRKSLKDSCGFTILADGEVAGMIVLEYPSRCRSSYEVNFVVGREFWNQGICTDALNQIVGFGFDELKIHKVFSDTDSDNPASGRVFEKAGFKKEGVFKEDVLKEGKYIDIIKWGLIERGQMGDLDQGAMMKVSIREMRETDTATLDELYADEEVAKQIFLPSDKDFVPGCPSSGSRGYNRAIKNARWIPEFRTSLKDSYPFTILADGKIAGEIGLEHPSICRSHYNVGFSVAPKLRNQGICTEALKQVVRFGFEELKIHRIVGDNDSDNPASGRVFEKAGFKKDGVFKEEVLKEGGYIDIIHWGLINPNSEDQNPEM
jgi:RimJ/RimL family protein N-acetyltransferase